MTRLLHIFGTIVGLLFAITATAQNTHLFTTNNGLSNSLINDIIQDKHGYIWIATEDGLNRFDGISFKSYHANDLSHSYVHSVYEDKKGDLWVGTIIGLMKYDRNNDSFSHVPIIIKGDTTEAHISDIIEDSHGNLWAASTGRGLLRIKDDTAFDCHDFVGIKEIEFISSVTIETKYNDNKVPYDFLWIVAYKNGIYRIDLKNKEVSLVPTSGNVTLAENAFTYCFNDKILLSANNANIMQYNEQKHIFEPSHIKSGNTFNYTLCKCNDELLIGTDGNGLFSYNDDSHLTKRIDLYSSHLNFSKAKIHSIFEDQDQDLWLGLFQKGVMYIPRSLSMIKTFGYRPNSTSNISSAAITAVEAGDDNSLWIGTDGNGLYNINKNGEAHHITSDKIPTIMDIKNISSDELWICAYNDGLFRYNVKLDKTEEYNTKLSHSQKNYNRRTTCMEYDKLGNLWVGTFGSGIYHISDNGTVKNYISTSEEINYNRNEPINNYINTIHVIDDNIWLGTYRGVSCYNTKIGAFTIIDPLLRQHIGLKVIYDICDDDNGTIWFATDIGLVRYVPMKKEIEIIDSKKGLASEIAVGVICDSLGRSWASTYNGISCYDPNNKTIDNYYSHHGLQGDQFSRAAITTISNGEIYFGSISGVTGFNPYSITPQMGKLDIKVTNFLLNGQEIKYAVTSEDTPITNKAVEETDTFNISYNDRTFALQLSTFNFTSTDRIRYEYRIKDSDLSWKANKPGDNIIKFRTPRPGTYNIEMQALLDNSRSAVKTITIIVNPMWWQEWWMIALCLIIIISIISLLISSIKERKRVKRELAEQEHAHNIDKAKFQFFFNLSHEIRTPLTLIINPIKELINQKSDNTDNNKKYALIYRNSVRILRLINQLLDVRKIEKGQMVMMFSSVNIFKFVNNLQHSFDYLAEKRDIKTTLNCKLAENTTADIDINQFDKVLYNVYSNAYKFTPDGGEINTTIYQNNDNIVISIADNGNGIDPQNLDKIFERFYQDNNNHNAKFVGTGIGLNYARSIVELHKGSISAANQSVGTGAIFTISIPQHQQGAVPMTESQQSDAFSTIENDNPQFADNALEVEKHRSSTNKVILIVDDEPEISTFLQNNLSKTYKIVCRSNGKEAYDYANKHGVNMVISDIMMPEMDGMTLCKKMKGNINLNHIPIILLTAKHSDEDRNKGLLTGADAYIAKPFDINVLRGTIHSILANRDRIMNRLNAAIEDSYTQANELPTPRKRIDLKSQNEVLMQKVTQYIDEHIADSDLNVEKLATHVGMSRVHMHRKLKELTGQSARDFIKNIRLRQAGILLGEKKLNISEVAYALGYNNLSYFSSTFKDFYGVSPKEYMNAALKIDDEATDETE